MTACNMNRIETMKHRCSDCVEIAKETNKWIEICKMHSVPPRTGAGGAICPGSQGLRGLIIEDF